jgi:cytochrome c heme-lyase
MGNQASIPSKTSEPILAAAATAQNAGCPVKHDTPAPAPAADGCPVKHDTKNFTAKLEGGCPVQHDKKGNKEVYNVYGERIDPTNMMPYNPNQEPNDQQRYPLTTERVQSTIPKGGTEGTWLYPSEQMFFNALKRKGKGEDVHEGQMSTIVAIHNNMNERAWAQVEQYEKVCHPE